MNRNKVLVLLNYYFIFLTIILITSLSAVYAQEFKEYENDLVQFQFPAEWDYVKNGNLIAQSKEIRERISFDIPETEGALTILIKDSEKKNLQEVLEEKINVYKQISFPGSGTKFDTPTVTDVFLSNEYAKKIIVNKESNEIFEKILSVISISNNKEYQITYRMNTSSYNDYLPIVEKIIESIKILE